MYKGDSCGLGTSVKASRGLVDTQREGASREKCGLVVMSGFRLHDGVEGVAGVGDVNIRAVGTSRRVPERTYEHEAVPSAVVRKMHAHSRLARTQSQSPCGVFVPNASELK